MGQLPSFKSRKEWESAVWDDFLRKIEKANLNKEIKVLIDSILSESEKGLIIRRLAAISLIKQGKTYKEIGEILWLSPTTISSIKKSLKSGLIYQSRRDFSKKKEKQGSLLEKSRKFDLLFTIIDDIGYWLSVMPSKSGGGRWKFLKSR